jgi:hypothetical protein
MALKDVWLSILVVEGIFTNSSNLQVLSFSMSSSIFLVNRLVLSLFFKKSMDSLNGVSLVASY